MTDNKISDGEVVSRLMHEVEIADDIGDAHSMMINIGLIKNALDLINRKDAEIERLNRELTSADEVIGFREAEIERLKEELDGETVKNMRLGHEVERLQKIIVGFMDEVGTWSNKYDVDISTIYKLPLLAKEDLNIRNNIKSEAYKEFYDKLTEKATIVIRKDIEGEPIDRLVYLKDIDDTYKELTRNLHGTCTEGGNEDGMD